MKIEIYNRESYEIRVYSMDTPDSDANAFIWEEGNYACDCNRELFFRRASGDPAEDSEDQDCGSERYAVLSVKTETGELIYFENERCEAWKQCPEEWWLKHR